MGKVSSATSSKSIRKLEFKDHPDATDDTKLQDATGDTKLEDATEDTEINRKKTLMGIEPAFLSAHLTKPVLKLQSKHAMKPNMLNTKNMIWKLAPEFVYMIDSYCSCILAIFQIFLAICQIAWQGSIQSILSDISKLSGLGDAFYNQPVEIQRNMAETFVKSQYHTYRSGLLSSKAVAAFLIVVALISIINTIVGWRAAMMAMRRTLILHRYFDIPLVVVNIAAVFWGFLATDCLLEMDIIERSLMENFMYYGDEGRYDSMINRIQQSLGCCGVHGPMDYVDANIRVNLPDNKSFGQFPTSCCREWWIRNVECGFRSASWIQPGSSMYDKILFTETIQQVGCIERISEVCSLFFPLYKYGMAVSFILYLIHIIIRYCTVVQMLREESAIRVRASQEVRANGRLGFPLWSAGNSLQSSDEEEPKYGTASTLGIRHDGKKYEPPTLKKSRKRVVLTQDMLQFYKDRAAFAEIESKLGKTYLGEWVEQARDTSNYATERDYGEDDEPPEELPERYRPNMPPKRPSVRGPTRAPTPPKRQLKPVKIIVPEPEEPIPEEPTPKHKKHRGKKGDHPYSHIVDYEHFRRMRKKLLKDKKEREREQAKKEIVVTLEEITRSPKPVKRKRKKRRSKHRKSHSPTSPNKRVKPHYVLKYKRFHQRYSLRKTPVLKTVPKEQPFPRWLL